MSSLHEANQQSAVKPVDTPPESATLYNSHTGMLYLEQPHCI